MGRRRVRRRARPWARFVKPVAEPAAANPHIRFDEREVETEHGGARETPATERAGHSWAPLISSSEGKRGRCLLNIGVQGLETAMSSSESRRVVRPASDDFDVAR